MARLSKLFILGLGLLLFSSCNQKEDPSPDISNIHIHNRFFRIDKKQHLLAQNNMDSLNVWVRANPPLWNILFREVLGIRTKISSNDTAFIHQWHEMIQDTVFRLLDRKVDSIYADFTPYREKIEKHLKYLKYYYPDHPTPDIYLVNSNLGVAHFLFEDSTGREGLTIGLDFYLGKSFPYHYLANINPIFSHYLSRHFKPDRLVRGTMWAIVNDIMGKPRGQRMLDIMIHNGKKLFLLQKLMPHTPDSVLINYTPKQIHWVKGNLKEIWALFLNQKLLYESTTNKIKTYVDHAPSSRSMPNASPGRTANWVGWQIVRSYARRHPEMGLIDLLQLEDAQKILTESKFKP